MNKNIYVIATETQYGYEEDSVKPQFITEVLHNLGCWDDETVAAFEALRLNSEGIPEDDSAFEKDKYFVLELKVND
jgi:hypothetical protein